MLSWVLNLGEARRDTMLSSISSFLLSPSTFQTRTRCRHGCVVSHLVSAVCVCIVCMWGGVQQGHGTRAWFQQATSASRGPKICGFGQNVEILKKFGFCERIFHHINWYPNQLFRQFFKKNDKRKLQWQRDEPKLRTESKIQFVECTSATEWAMVFVFVWRITGFTTTRVAFKLKITSYITYVTSRTELSTIR